MEAASTPLPQSDDASTSISNPGKDVLNVEFESGIVAGEGERVDAGESEFGVIRNMSSIQRLLASNRSNNVVETETHVTREDESELDRIYDLPQIQRLAPVTMAAGTSETETVVSNKDEGFNIQSMFQRLFSEMREQSKEMNNKLDNQSRKLEEQRKELNNKFDTQRKEIKADMNDRFDSQSKELKKEFESKLSEKFDTQSRKFEDIKASISEFKDEMRERNRKFEAKISSKLSACENRFQSIESGLSETIGVIRNNVREEIKEMNNEIVNHRNSFDKVRLQISENQDEGRRIRKEVDDIRVNISETHRKLDHCLETVSSDDGENPCTVMKKLENYFVLVNLREEQMNSCGARKFLKITAEIYRRESQNQDREVEDAEPEKFAWRTSCHRDKFQSCGHGQWHWSGRGARWKGLCDEGRPPEEYLISTLAWRRKNKDAFVQGN